jgi:hypothetical protein
MKALIIFLVTTGLLFATADSKVLHGRSKAYMDTSETASGLHLPRPASRQNEVLVDSSGNGYSMWTQMHECLAYNPTMIALQFVNRGYSVSGVLYVHQSDNILSFWVDELVYNAGFGYARYPTSVASDDGSTNGPHISMPVLDPAPDWGYQIAQYESGGWYSTFWDTEVDLGPGAVDIHKNIGKQLSNGNMLFIGVTDTDLIRWETWDAGLTGEIASGSWSANDYVGFDINGSIAYVFYEDGANPPNVYYKTTADGVNWSGQQTWTIPWPDPYPGENNYMFWKQMAVTDAGTPVLVFDILWDLDPQFPISSKVYVSPASGSVVQVSDDTCPHCNYPTIAAGGGKLIVIYQCVTDSTPDSLTRRDIFATGSYDGGTTWTTPMNLTAGQPVRPGLPQLAKRLDVTNGNFFYCYGINIATGHDPYWHVGWDPEGLDPHAWYGGLHSVPGVEEHSTEAPSRLSLTITNPVLSRACVSYALPEACDVSLTLFDRCGRLVRLIKQGYKDTGIHQCNLDTRDLASGTYMLLLDTADKSLTQIFIVIH